MALVYLVDLGTISCLKKYLYLVLFKKADNNCPTSYYYLQILHLNTSYFGKQILKAAHLKSLLL